MCSRVLVLLLLAMSRNHGTMSFVFGPLAAFTPAREASSPAPSASTLQWTLGADATTVTTTATTTTATSTTTPYIRRRPTVNRRRPIHGNIVFPTDDNFSSFTAKNPLPNSQNSKDHSVLTKDRSSVNTEQHFLPGLTPRPIRPEPTGQGSDDAIVFDGPSSLQNHGDRRRVRPPARPLMFESPTASSVGGDRRRVRPTGRPLVFGSPGVASDVAMQGLPPQGFPPQGLPSQGWPSQGLPPQGLPPQGLPSDLPSPSPPPPCLCPTTSESNPVCAEVQGARVTMFNMSEFKCAQICVGETDVTLLFHGTCQKTITKLHPFIHD